jgi:hypothetical protein
MFKNNNLVTNTVNTALFILGEEIPDERKSGFTFE